MRSHTPPAAKRAWRFWLATGVRPRSAAAHVVTFEAAAAIASRFKQRRVVDEAGQLRFVRHGAEYRAEVVSDCDAGDAIHIGDELLSVVSV